jgi:heat shock protein HtpX
MYERVASNVRKTWLLIAIFVLLVVGVGFFLGYYTNIWWAPAAAVIFAILMTWGSYFSSDKIALSVSRAKPAEGTRYNQLHNIVEGLSIAAGLPKPRVYVVEDQAPNAFATGRNPEHAAVAVTTGLLAKLNRDELEGVIAHELSHIKNRDTLVMTIAVTLVGVVVLLADAMVRMMWWGSVAGGGRDRRNGIAAPLAILGFVLLLLSPLFAQLLQFAISRQREFLADAGAVELTKNPDAMITALRKIEGRGELEGATSAVMEMCVDNPRSGFADLFATHPSIDSRVEAIVRFAGGHDPGPIALPEPEALQEGATEEHAERPTGPVLPPPGQQTPSDAGRDKPFLPAQPPIEIGGAAPSDQTQPSPWGPPRR